MKIIKWRRDEQKRMSKMLDLRLMMKTWQVGTKDGEKNIYILDKTRKMKTRDLNCVKECY